MLLSELVHDRACRGTVEDAVVRFAGHPPHRHPCAQLVHVAVGRGVLVTAAGRFALVDGEGVWVPSGCEHALELDQGGIVLGPLLPAGADPPDGLPRRITDPGVRRLLTTLLGVAPRTAEDVQVFRGALAAALRAASGQHFPLQLPTHPAALAIARDAVRSGATLTQLAAREFLSARQVQRLFLDQTGLPFATWRTRARLNAAMEELRAGRGAAAALSASGFLTREGLRKAMARETGLPGAAVAAQFAAVGPSAYDRAHRGGPSVVSTQARVCCTSGQVNGSRSPSPTRLR